MTAPKLMDLVCKVPAKQFDITKMKNGQRT